jgi:hypothetical protein
MARYSCSYGFPVSLQEIYSVMTEILEACQLTIDFQAKDYIMAKENSQDRPFISLVNVDIIIDLATAQENNTVVNIVIKNEELALSKNNHALEKLKEMKQIITENYQAESLPVKL